MKREVKSVRKEKHLLGDAFVLLFCRWLRKVLVKICGAFHYPGFYSLRFVPFFLLCLFIVPAQAADDLAAQIAARIEQHPVLRASFEQEKQMAALKRPLLTAGKLTLSRQHGVLWQIERPYRMSYVLAETRIVEIDASGQRRERGGKEVPGLAQVGRVFRAMLGGKLDVLRETFEVTVSGDLQKWQVKLKPLQAAVAQYLLAMELSGSEFVEGVTLIEAGGDTTQIRFRNSSGAQALKDDERQVFGANAGS